MKEDIRLLKGEHLLCKNLLFKKYLFNKLTFIFRSDDQQTETPEPDYSYSVRQFRPDSTSSTDQPESPEAERPASYQYETQGSWEDPTSAWTDEPAAEQVDENYDYYAPPAIDP